MSTEAKARYTVEEYLALERASETRSEYHQGEIFAMTGASRRHNLLVANLLASLHGQLRGRPCEVYASDMRVQVAATEFFAYPDLSVVCGEPRFADEHLDTLVNPTLLIEVLSRTTSDYDRGTKFAHYRQLDSLREYLLFAQDRVHVEHYERQADGSWRLRETDDLGATVPLPAIDCRLPLAEAYEKVPL